MFGGSTSQATAARQLGARGILQYKEDGFLIIREVFTADDISVLDMDDYGNVYRRGAFTPLNVHDWQMLSKGDAAESFLLLAPGATIEAASTEAAPPTPTSSVKGA
jgi:hypothetical protein